MMMSSAAWAGWTLNLGYHNPPGSLVGLNFLYLGSSFGFELGAGWLQFNTKDTDHSPSDNDKDTAAFAILGDANIKYYFRPGTSVRPYIQGGMDAAIGGDVGKTTDLGAGIGGPFFGLGLFLGKPSFYGYGAVNTGQGGMFVQGGLGFGL